MRWMILPFRRYFEFRGRSRRMEFWMFALLNVIVNALLIVLVVGTGATQRQLAMTDPDGPAPLYGMLFGGAGLLILLWALIVLIPSISVSVRRLHDRDLSGWWYLVFVLLSLIPVVGFLAAIVFVVFMALPGTPGANRYGPDPKGAMDAEVFE